MSKLVDQISQTLMPGMVLSDPLRQLFEWIEQNGYYVDRESQRIGLLYPEDKLKSGWTDQRRPGGTIIEFSAEGNSNLHHWFGHSRYDVLNRLCVFAKTGTDGSMAAFWLDDNRNQKIVHLGSGSGSTMVCVLASDPVDFLRLLAIGYDEICWDIGFSNPPNFDLDEEETFVEPNVEFQNWVKQTFNVTIPETASEIVIHPSEMGDANAADEFCRWVELNT